MIMKKLVKTKTIYLALSGGVDSAVAAVLLKKQGYQVIGCFMKNWSDESGVGGDCPWERDQKDAQAVCEHLGIEFRSYNFEKQYRAKVISYFFAEIKAGRTPNPDVLCNSEIKFGIFLQRALEDGADLIATGHYARVKKEDDVFKLLKGIDSNKDQSYFLCELDQEQLSKTQFPIGEYTKPQIRQIALDNKLPVADKKDSQGICFVGKINVGKFLRDNIKGEIGLIMDIDSKRIVGKHDGVAFYTIGQREGLNIGGSSLPYFVCGKDKINNILYVAKGKDNARLFSSEVEFDKIHYVIPQKYWDSDNLSASIRYRQKAEVGKLIGNKFSFASLQRAIAQGQKIVFYNDDVLLGSATII